MVSPELTKASRDAPSICVRACALVLRKRMAKPIRLASDFDS